ncbi:ABC transporter permease [Candidatus Bathyarchaeota archaeon]|nr:ABC transporter permease [Candidatus Bathyarchaeota archaeon]
MEGLRSVVALLLLSLVAFASHAVLMCSGSNGDETVRVYGRVIDYNTGEPIPDAKICVVNQGVWIRWVGELIWLENYGENLVVKAETDSLGLFEMHADRASLLYNPSRREMIFFAYYDDNATSGVDYVPSYKLIYNDGSPEYYLEFSLLPGASINLTENPFFSPSELIFSCEIMDENNIVKNISIVTRFIAWKSDMRESRVMFVPANFGVKIRVGILVFSGRYDTYDEVFNFTIPSDGSYMHFKQGEQVTLDLKEHRLLTEAYTIIPHLIDNAKLLADKIGVLSTYERLRIRDAEGLLSRARNLLSKGDYTNSQADLYEAELILKDVENSLLSIFQNSAASIYLLTPFIGISSSSLGALLFRDKRRIFVSIIIYAILVLTLYYAYPGYMIAREPTYNPLTGTPFEPLLVPIFLAASFLLGFILINAPYMRGERSDRRTLSLRSAIVSSFSLAAENLKRRKVRTFLVMSTIAISVLAFINLTSFIFEEGFVVEKTRGITPSEGIFICQQPASNIYPYGPLDSEILTWLNRHENVCLSAPLLKSLPQVAFSPMPIGELSAVKKEMKEEVMKRYNVFGVLGVKPSMEINVTGIDQIIDAGNFLSDLDLDGILISDEASRELGVDIKDKVTFCGRNFTVVGTFNSARLKEMKDLNGRSILPQNVRILITEGGPSYVSEYVSPENVVIVLDETASKLPLNIAVVRAVSRTLNSEQMLPLARVLTLTFSRVEAFVSLEGEITHLYVGHRLAAHGFAESSILLILTSLNVGVTLLNSVYERRREIMTLSTVGLNPTQIAAIFLCEALIMAFIAGSLGYLFGLVNYHILFSSSIAPVVKYKAEASWCMLALLLSAASSMIGSLIPSLKASLKMTPSLLRRFALPSGGIVGSDTWVIEVPLKIVNYWDLGEFFLFIERKMRDYSGPSHFEEKVEKVRLEGDVRQPESLRLKFSYKYGSDYVNTENTLFAAGDPRSGYTIKLSSRTPLSIYWGKENVWQTASFIRRLALEYTEKEKIESGFSK